MKQFFFKRKVKALSLMEVMVVLLIIGIITNLVLPKLMPTISKAKSMEAQLQLAHLHTLEKTYFYQYSKFSSTLAEIGFEQEKLASQGGNANYQLEVVSSSNAGFVARATAVTDFDGDGVFNIWEIDQDKNLKEVTAD